MRREIKRDEAGRSGTERDGAGLSGIRRDEAGRSRTKRDALSYVRASSAKPMAAPRRHQKRGILLPIFSTCVVCVRFKISGCGFTVGALGLRL